MARKSQTISVLGVVLVALVVQLCPGIGAETAPHMLCTGVPSKNCTPSMSGLCHLRKPNASCDHQLHQTELLPLGQSSRCQVEKFSKDCGSLQPSRMYRSEKPLVEMHLYHYQTWIGRRAVVNFTFPSPDWNDLKLQYKINGSNERMQCRQFSLHGVSLPLNDTLVYDCVGSLLKVPEETVWDGQVTVVNNKGDGRTYSFRLPKPSQIHPNYTRLQDWHVFFYLHHDFIAEFSHLPVTVQSYFPDVSYNVSMVKCLDSEISDCGDFSILYSTLEHPKEDTWTVRLPIWSNPGGYAVTVQIESPECAPKTGCYVSVSPRFEIAPSFLGVWITIGMGCFLISFLTFLLIFNHRLQTNKRILQRLREVQPSVLLVYLPETQQHLEFISVFAEFLKNSCHLLLHLVDRDVGNQDPNCWTRNYIMKADKVLFIVPGKPEAESITPIRNQWIIALNYLSGYHFTIRQMTRKVAVVILPSSGNIPCEILHARRFKLLDEIGALVTWLHNGTWLDEMFLWRPHIRSSGEKTAHTWSEVKNAAMRTSLPPGIHSADPTNSLSLKNIFFTNTNNQVIAFSDNDSIHSEDSTAHECSSHSSVPVFDPDIPSIKELHNSGSESSMKNGLLEDISDSSDEEGIFT